MATIKGRMIINGDSAKELKKFKDNSIDAVITDPPYSISFLGKEWDKNTGAIEIWQECLRVLKPGGYLLAFSAARTYHILATNIQSVGFEIRDQIMWLYASGFPKAQDIGKAIERRQQKRKNNPLGICRSKIESGPKTYCPKCEKSLNGTNQKTCKDTVCPLRDEMKPADNKWAGWKTQLKPAHEPICMARKPFKGSHIDNVLKHGVGALNIDESRIPYEDAGEINPCIPQAGRRTASFSFGNKQTHAGGDGSPEYTPNEQGRFPSNVIGEVEGYQKYFYCPKVSRKERMDFNTHPTVKPVALMRYLIKLVAPQGSHILDPFMGSGSTGMACKELGYKFTGIEMDANYVDICIRRIEATKTDPKHTLFK